jgi:hypothetical protein
VETDFQGLFRLANLSDGWYRITVSHPRLLVVHNEEIVVSGDLEVVVRLEAVRVRGQVVEAYAPVPIADALVVFSQLADTAQAAEVSRTTVATDSRGMFVVERLAVGSYRLTVERDGYAPVTKTLALQSQPAPYELRLELEPAEGAVILPRLASGASPQWVHARFTSESGAVVVAESRNVEVGIARFPRVPRGDWWVTVAAAGGAPVTFTTSVPGPPSEVRLPEAGSLLLHIPDLAESHVSGRVRLLSPSGVAASALDGETGELREEWWTSGGKSLIQAVSAGVWQVEVVASDGRSWAGTVREGVPVQAFPVKARGRRS